MSTPVVVHNSKGMMEYEVHVQKSGPVLMGRLSELAVSSCSLLQATAYNSSPRQHRGVQHHGCRIEIVAQTLVRYAGARIRPEG